MILQIKVLSYLFTLPYIERAEGLLKAAAHHICRDSKSFLVSYLFVRCGKRPKDLVMFHQDPQVILVMFEWYVWSENVKMLSINQTDHLHMQHCSSKCGGLLKTLGAQGNIP